MGRKFVGACSLMNFSSTPMFFTLSIFSSYYSRVAPRLNTHLCSGIGQGHLVELPQTVHCNDLPNNPPVQVPRGVEPGHFTATVLLFPC
jgi:hypothetical protein